ncbi:DNA-dependent protein kinase catalytic subunit-like [Venturia canescens]|uniref:DNA-dependent protein kinase catalytic subunit-like n=1 Tax=Venturia canescens TaxID=32260 RepID=UPI001C9C439F|nr:DNA-dependent protein kinase catalytic subunit-like [Venturia canescens]
MMDSIKKFMDIFETKRMSSSWLEMTAILKECDQYFKNVPASEKGVILSILFDERKGLLAFLADALEQVHITKELEAAINQTFTLLIPIMNQCADDYRPYIKPTMAVLKLALIIKSSCYLKKAAVTTFIELILVFKSLDLDFHPIVIECVKKLHLYSIQERRLIIQILSVISLYFPQTEAFAHHGKTILRQLMADFKETYEAKKSVQCFGSYVESLNNMLHNFPPNVDDSGSIGSSSLYKQLKNLCNSKANQENKSLMLEVVKLLSNHLSLFDEHVYEDYQFWHITLKTFVNNGVYGDSATEALRNFYRTMGSVLGRKNSPQDKKVFLDLHQSFFRSLERDVVPSNVLRLVVYGFSQIIEPCKQYLASAGVEEMFSLIVRRSSPLYSRENDEDTCFEELADYQEALSRIIRFLDNVSIDQMRALTALCSLMIKRFPELSIDDQRYATFSLNRTIINVRYTKEIFYQDFITNILYDGIVWSCSHMLLIDADLQRDISGTTENPITYKDYVPLWRGLLNPENYSFATENNETRAAALQMVVDEVVTTCIRLMNTLNLNVSAKSNESLFEDEETLQVPSNKSDFRIFLNLVDLYVEILPSIETFLWSNVLEKFIYELIKNSYRNPLISGFYKLVNATLASSGAFLHDETIKLSNNESFNLILQYLWNVMDALPHYPQELQISCLQLVLNIPETFVHRIVDRAVPAFQISLNLGLTNYEIATAALTALERWHEYLGAECPKKFISQIVPCLAMFLQSEESSERLIQDIDETRRRRGGKGAKNVVTLVDDERTVEMFQKRILLFFGALDNETMSEFIHSRSLKTGATWSKKDLLKYPMPFPDTDLDVNLDSMLPRIIELAQSSGDRSTRIAACEVLHTIVAFMLGKTVPLLTYDKDRFSALYESVCPALLRLGCDPDDVIMQLFHPLVIQLTHWLTSSFMLDSLTTIHLVDSIFDGLSDETNSSLRDVSAVYLAEFVRWSIKQSSDRRLAQCPTNIQLIVRRIVESALDPSTRKRVAAAIAFNHLYRILRENDEIVNTFWLVIFHAFVRSLDGCDDVRIDDSIKHVQRVFIEKSRIFNRTDSRRLRPPGFEGSTMIETLQWILQQCTSLDRICRRKCKQLFVALSPTVQRANSPKAILSEYLKTHEIVGLNEILIGNSSVNCSTTTDQGLMAFQRTLDLYTWLIQDRLIDHEILFTEINPQKMIIFNRIENFLMEGLSIVDSLIVENKATSDLREIVKSKTQRCETILTLFDFILVILDVKATNSSYIPDAIFSENYFSFVANCLMKPQKLGFDSSNLQLTEQLPSKLEPLVKKAANILSPELVTRMTRIFANEIDKFAKKLFQFDDMTDSKVWIHENCLKGVILLRKCGILKICNDCESITSEASEKMEKIFDILKKEEFGTLVCFHPKSETKIYLQSLVELLLTDYEIETTKKVVELVTNERKLHRSDASVITHGEYFFSLFKAPIVQGFLKEPEATLNLLENSVKVDPDNSLRMVEAIVLHLQRNKSDYKEIMESCANAIIGKFSVFERSVNNLDHRRNIFLNIYAIVVRLRRDRLIERDSDPYRWLMGELVSCKDFKYKIRLLEDFLVCLVNERSGENPEITAVLGNLKNERKFASPEESSEKKRATPETMNYFQVLLKLLPVTRSTILLDAVINFSAGAGEVFCKDDKITGYLKLYYDASEISNVSKSLDVTYNRFMTRTNANERLDVLRYFLLPSLSQCTHESMEKFFERNIREIYSTIMEKTTMNVHDRSKLFVSKIASYNLMEILFANLSRDRIDSSESCLMLETRSPGSSKDEKLSRQIFRSTLPVRQLRAVEGDDREIVRLVHCAAYKCCITIVSTTNDDRFYLAVFGENREKNQLIWENIIDVKRKYDLSQTSKKYPKEREKLVNIKKASGLERRNDDRYSYIKSYDLATSTLNENISAYDLNSVNLIPRKNIDSEKSEGMTLTLEIDDLNEHECMPLVCGLLRHMNENVRAKNDETQLPKWMGQFRASMWSEQPNVRLFLLKIVLNTQSIFRPYAQHFLEPVTNTIYRCLKETHSLNYLITDALVMLVDWREISVPGTEREENLARLMFAHLVEKSTAAPTRYIVKYNLSLVEMVVDAWHDCLVVPKNLEDRISRDDRTALKLILIFLTNRMPEKIVARADIWEFVVHCLSDWKIEEVTVLQSYEAAGLILKYSSNEELLQSRKATIAEKVSSVFREMRISKPDRLLKCVHSLCKACNDLAPDFFQFVSSVRLRVEPTNIVKCLEVFSLLVPNITREEIVKELNFMRFNTFLENKVLSCEEICLKIVHQLVDVLEPRELSSLVKLAAPYSDHEVLQYRRSCHEIFVKVYKKYSSEEIASAEENNETLNISKKVLLSGLLDPAEEIQKISFSFWSDVVSLRDKCAERFLDILDTYGCGVEKKFLQIITLMLLEFTRKSVTCDKKMFEPLHGCTYNDHEISVSWKPRNYGSKIPLYAPSLASQLHQRFTQYSCAAGASSWNDRDSQGNYVLRGTDAAQFETTYLSAAPTIENSGSDISENAVFAVPEVPSLPRNKVSRRFLAEWSDVAVEMKKREESKRTREMEYRREYLARQRGRVRLRRKYRIGDFPDVEIRHSTILEPLQELIKRDEHACKDLLVTLSRSMIQQTKSCEEMETYKNEVSKRFTRILKDGRENGGAVATVLEILFDARGLECPWAVVAQVARADRLHAKGAILVEQSLIPKTLISEPPRKRARVTDSGEKEETKERWIELAVLYESMNELDVVLAIFRGDLFTEKLHRASLARASDDWATAEKFYREAFESEVGTQTKQHCLQGAFECLSRLGQWKLLERDIKTRTNENFGNLLAPSSDESRWLAPWLFRTCTQRLLEGHGNREFLLAMETLLNDPTSYQSLKETYGEETAVAICKKRPEKSRDFLNGSWENVRKTWLRLSPLAVPLRFGAVDKLRRIYDTDKYLRTLDSPDLPKSIRELTRLWNNRTPSSQDDLLPRQIEISYRSYFSDGLINLLGNDDSQESIDLVEEIRFSKLKQMLRLVDCSLRQKNEHLTKKYLLRVDEQLQDRPSKFLSEYELDAVKFRFLQAQRSTESSQIIKYYSSAWTKIHEILDTPSSTLQCEIAMRKLLSEVAVALAKLADEKRELFEELASRTSIAQDIFTERIDFNSPGDALNYYCLTNLLKCCNLAPKAADCHLRLSKYCYENISLGNGDAQLSREFVRSTLRAMSCGSEEATYYFPCLLKGSVLSNDGVPEIFLEESANVETWRFLIWQTQILSHLSTRNASLVKPIVKRMIEAYPNAMVYSLRLVLDTCPKITENPFLPELETFLLDKREFNQFLQALEYVVPPKLYVQHYLCEFLKNFIVDREKAFDKLKSKLYPDDSDRAHSSLCGDALEDLVVSFEAEIEAMVEAPEHDVVKRVHSILKRVDEASRKRRDKTDLRFYSPWLNDYMGRDIEVPGQYGANRKPTPRYHAKMIKVESTVRVMQSIRKPIRITILANDGKSYRFLVKFGEDLRLDQRVEQIFDVMNDKLRFDPACFRRRLAIDTYQVFPLSGVLGLIQWIDGTKTLREYIDFSINSEENNRHRQLETLYEQWIRRAAPGSARSIQYKEALLKYKHEDVRDKMEELMSKTELDTLRKTFVALSTCIESFVSIRGNFISSYATMSIVQWILGIGDRHPDNTLVAVESGRCLGIDFGSAFGGGIDQSVPELMPFRLTPQIKGLLEPFGAYDSMGNTMIHVLRALGNSKGSLIACLDVVAHEPLNWEEHILKMSQETEHPETEIKWLPTKKVEFVSKKLDGFKPSTIILEQLAENHSEEKYFSRYTKVVNGTDSDDNSKRSSMMEENLSPDEQVQCLIEQATDLNILGRTYAGWAPWL